MTVLVLYAALLLSLAFPNPLDPAGYPVLSWCFGMLLFSAIDGEPCRRRLAAGLLFGAAAYSLLLDWFASYSLPGFVLFVVSLTLQPLLFAWAYPYSSSQRVLRLVFVPALWVTTEYLRQLMLQGFSWDLAHSQTSLAFVLPWVTLAGSKGLSFVLILVNFALYQALIRYQERRFYGTVIAAVVGTVVFYGWIFMRQPDNRVSTVPLRAALIQPNREAQRDPDARTTAENVAVLCALTARVAPAAPDLILWPETAVPEDLRSNPVLREAVFQAAQGGGALLLGSVVEEAGETFNSALLLDSRGGMRDVYRKHLLIPFTETQPWQRWGGLFERFQLPFTTFSPGPAPHPFEVSLRGVFFADPSVSTRTVKVGAAICAEDTDAGLFRRYARAGAEAVVVLLNDGWFQDPRALALHAQNTVVRAVENGLPVVRAANSGWSGVVDFKGRVISASSGLQQQGAEVVTVPAGLHPTLQTRIGDNFSRLCSLFVIMNFILFLGRRAHSRVRPED